jgi:hypothetical protein
MFLRRSLLTAALLSPLALFSQQTSSSPSMEMGEGVGEVFAGDASVHGSVLLAGGGPRLLSGSTVAAGAQAARVRLARGGELRVCPETKVTVNATARRELMLSLSAGALEAYYTLGASADSIVTPDFRILLIGPGQFHLAIGADFRGNACVKSLQENSAAVLVSELMGDGSYQVKPGEQVHFRNGTVREPSAEPLGECGCPAPGSVQNLLQAAAVAPPVVPPPPATQAPPSPVIEQARVPAAIEQALQTVADQATVPAVPASAPGDVHVQVEAPFVFSAAEPEPAPEPATIAELRSLSAPSILDTLFSESIAPPAEAAVVAQPKKRRGFFARIGGFFAAMFGSK